MYEVGHWQSPYTEDQINASSGFTYLITHKESGVMYVGKKFTQSVRRKVVKGKTRKRKEVSKSNWLTYTSSSKYVNEEIAKNGKDAFVFEILAIHSSRAETNYAELEEQIKRDVLRAKDSEGNHLYANLNIALRFYRDRIAK
ncbi:hypothetical protein HKD28_15335 [Gluconobacter sp. LMG 1744]|uniref:hypothetical protein n=1 Tax=Gluconobacter cadivus TaxID=2728101 RepID=UPI001884979D|nr:hypothetical protein [Gluconobacter cadivus]MBF0892764.1 hypothetical protein [Gluconobacter cadivus]